MQPSEPSQSPSPDTDFCALTSVADTLAQRLGMKPLPTTASRFALGAEWHYFGTGGSHQRHERSASARRQMVAPTGFEPVFQP